MKVTDERSSIQDVTQNQATQNRKGATQGAAPFDRILQEKSRADNHATLTRMLERITEQGELIAKRRDLSDVRKYRELVSGFLEEAMSSTYEADKQGSFDPRGRYKEYSIVKKVNIELEKLTKQVLEEQKDNLAILEQLGTIRGLLIDLMV
jgi:uncharacterized protein YaaR (DUF327 family)